MESLSLSAVGLTIQCAGIILITCLSFFMTRSLRRTFLDYWTAAWACMSLALVSVTAAFPPASLGKAYFAVYYLGEYAFGFLFVAGCRNYASGEELRRRDWLWLVPGAAVACCLATLPPNFNVAFVPHAAILAAMFALALWQLQKARRTRPRSPGLSVLNIALMLLTLDFLHYVPAMSYSVFFHRILPKSYLQYTSVYDLILEILLGFGTLMLVMDNARHDVEAANRELQAAHDRLQKQARMDPLTEALNRHAFYSLVAREPAESAVASGCAVVLDIDNLKPINDSYGHAAGDAAIREVARAVRSAIRGDDLLFRWGGDEFLILFFNMDEPEALKRVAAIDKRLAGPDPAAPGAPLRRLIVSHGVATFARSGEIERAIDAADSAMYASKQERKRGHVAR